MLRNVEKEMLKFCGIINLNDPIIRNARSICKLIMIIYQHERELFNLTIDMNISNMTDF
jgi:hypothetical protein